MFPYHLREILKLSSPTCVPSNFQNIDNVYIIIKLHTLVSPNLVMQGVFAYFSNCIKYLGAGFELFTKGKRTETTFDSLDHENWIEALIPLWIFILSRPYVFFWCVFFSKYEIIVYDARNLQRTTHLEILIKISCREGAAKIPVWFICIFLPVDWTKYFYQSTRKDKWEISELIFEKFIIWNVKKLGKTYFSLLTPVSLSM